MQGVQFQATIWDIDPDPYGSDIIDVITLNINRTVMPGDPFLAKVITGFYNIATLNFSYQVLCDQGFYGDYCQYFNDCPSDDVCRSNGTCLDGQSSYSCQCDPGFTGENCELILQTEFTCDPGENYDAQNHALATTASQCDPGYTGAQCTINIDDCVE